MNDRIKLAEAMGFLMTDSYKELNFDPFADANDDYEVLQWMRKKKEDLGVQDFAFIWGKFAKSLKHACWYEVGDYARAAVLVLDRQEQK